LDDESFGDWNKLLDELKRHRRAEAEDHRHMLYRLAPEAWLESILRRDITRLDPGLIIAPLYAQFRTSRATGAAPRPVDLLARRRERSEADAGELEQGGRMKEETRRRGDTATRREEGNLLTSFFFFRRVPASPCLRVLSSFVLALLVRLNIKLVSALVECQP